MTKTEFNDMFFTAYCQLYNAEEGSPAEHRARGEIDALKRITRRIYGREEAHEIRKKAATDAKYICSEDE